MILHGIVKHRFQKIIGIAFPNGFGMVWLWCVPTLPSLGWQEALQAESSFHDVLIQNDGIQVFKEVLVFGKTAWSLCTPSSSPRLPERLQVKLSGMVIEDCQMPWCCIVLRMMHGVGHLHDVLHCTGMLIIKLIIAMLTMSNHCCNQYLYQQAIMLATTGLATKLWTGHGPKAWNDFALPVFACSVNLDRRDLSTCWSWSGAFCNPHLGMIWLDLG